ncbi:MAG: hypothetical protein IPK82_03865 [Polyangiaceae bacterium]|nr:hypothetical protein [Polyangiaceae bacterium]
MRAWNDGLAVSSPPKKQSVNKRGSADAIAKRRAARAFNEMVLGPTSREGDGRTERKRRRMLKELADGATGSGQELKPMDVLLRVQWLLNMGETVESLKKVRPQSITVKVTDALINGVKQLNDAYDFAPEVYRFVGIDDNVLVAAGVVRKKRGPVKARERAVAAAKRGAA